VAAISRRFFTCTPLLLLCACTSVDAAAKKEEPPAPPDSAYRPSDATIRDVAAARAAITAILDETPRCIGGEAHPGCELVEVEASGADINWQDADPASRILIIDGGKNCDLMKGPAEGRYKHRIFDRFRLTPFGDYVACSSRMKFPRALAKILHDTPGAHQYVPAKGIGRDVSDAVIAKFPNAERHYSHGNAILSMLAEYNPRATFALAEVPNRGPRLLCFGTDAELNEFDLHVIASLETIILFDGIRYVNFAAGVTRDSIREALQTQCVRAQVTDERIDALMLSSTRWIRALSNIPGVTFVQAGASIGEGEPLENYEPDCSAADMPNRLRVAHFDAPHSTISQNGATYDSPWGSSIPQWYRGGAGCLDIYMNSGLFPPPPDDIVQASGSRPAESGGSTGFGVAPLPLMSTSYAAPLALSYLINAVATGGDHDPKHLFGELTHNGAMPLHDPLLNENLEAFRLHKAWFWGDE
jgi:hypothetical protein